MSDPQQQQQEDQLGEKNEQQQQGNLLDKIETLDDEQVRNRIQAIFQERDQHMQDYFTKLYDQLQQVVNLIQQFATAQDQVLLQEMENEMESIHEMESQQERLRDQIVRFIHATSSSFQEIFNESPTPP